MLQSDVDLYMYYRSIHVYTVPEVALHSSTPTEHNKQYLKSWHKMHHNFSMQGEFVVKYGMFLILYIIHL